MPVAHRRHHRTTPLPTVIHACAVSYLWRDSRRADVPQCMHATDHNGVARAALWRGGRPADAALIWDRALTGR